MRAGTARIGVYDSRAIAVAFVGSEAHDQWLRKLMADVATAKTAGDQKRVKELESEGSRAQQQLHQQGFSTAPVDNLLKHVEDRLPAIRKEAGVSTLISKWDKDGLAKYPGAEQVDVTLSLVKAFHPNERQLKSAAEVQKHQPIPLDKARKIKD